MKTVNSITSENLDDIVCVRCGRIMVQIKTGVALYNGTSFAVLVCGDCDGTVKSVATWLHKAATENRVKCVYEGQAKALLESMFNHASPKPVDSPLTIGHEAGVLDRKESDKKSSSSR